MFQPGLFDQQEILSRRDKRGDVLARLNGAVEWKVFEPIIKKGFLQKSPFPGRAQSLCAIAYVQGSYSSIVI